MTRDGYDSFIYTPTSTELPDQVDELLAQQRRTWPMLREGYEQLASLQTRPLQLSHSEVVIQFNPQRIRNTQSFKKADVEQRPCFLCAQNLPPEERGLAYGDDFVIFGNPFPILPDHLTIVRRRHQDQRLAPLLSTGLELARALAHRFLVLYNGPEVGASAPDHAHLQAGSRAILPLESELARLAPSDRIDVVIEEGVESFVPTALDRSVLVLRGADQAALERGVARVLERLPPGGETPESLVNLVFTFQSGSWTLYLFPRTTFRPLAFSRQGDDQLLISPAALELAGLIVAPRAEDFERLTARDVEQIFSEVSLPTQTLVELLE